jgi:two-component sensor histidine kinase/PAS domain-containing protein
LALLSVVLARHEASLRQDRPLADERIKGPASYFPSIEKTYGPRRDGKDRARAKAVKRRMPPVSAFDAPDFRAVFSELTGLYLLLTPDLRIVAASKAYLRATGQTEGIVGRHVFEAFPDSADNEHGGRQALAASFERVLTHRTPDSMPLQRYDLVHADGSSEVRYWSPVNTPVFDAAGRVSSLLHRVSDVTAAVKEGARSPRVAELEGELFHTAGRLSAAYAELRQGEARLRLALEVGGMAMWDFRVEDEALTITPELNVLLGLEPEHATTLPEVRSGFVDETDYVWGVATRAWAAGERTFEHRFRYRRHRDQGVAWLHLRAEILCTPVGAPSHVLGVLQDVSDQVAVQERQQTLINELNHRVKNNLALVQSLARRTFRGAGCDAALDRFIDRLIGLASTHEILTRSAWSKASLADLVAAGLRGLAIEPERVAIEGPDLGLHPDLAVAVSLAIHELATNAIKYGALSQDGGRVSLSWTVSPGGRLALVWRERGGPVVRAPARTGFGSELLARIFRSAGGAVQTLYEAEGVVCRIEVDAA